MNHSSNDTSVVDTSLPLSFSATFSVLGIVVFIVNIFTFGVIIHFKQLRENHAILIGSLSVADALTGLSVIAAAVLSYQITDICSIYSNWFETCLNVWILVSQWHTVSLSIDRLIAVKYALTYHTIMTPHRLRILIVVTWVVGCVEATLLGLWFIPDACIRLGYDGYSTSYFYQGHISVIFVINALVYTYLWRTARFLRGQIGGQEQAVQHSPTSPQNPQHKIDKATVIVIAIVGLYGMLWLPTIVCRIAIEFTSDELRRRLSDVNEYLNMLGFVNSVVNCLVYGSTIKNKLRR